MELIMFVALIFMLWLLVQLGVGIYHQGLRRGLRRWVRGLPHLISVILVSTLRLIGALVAGGSGPVRFGQKSFPEGSGTTRISRPGIDASFPGEPDVGSTIDHIFWGYPYEPPEARKYRE